MLRPDNKRDPPTLKKKSNFNIRPMVEDCVRRKHHLIWFCEDGQVWTHRTPYVPSDLTEESIERHGRIALYRALSLDRVIVFAGSGVSAAYGGPAWSDFAVFMAQKVGQALCEKDLPAGLDTVRDHLAKLLGTNAKGLIALSPEGVTRVRDNLTTVLALCEDALRLLSLFPRSAPASDTSKITRSSVRAELAKRIAADGAADELRRLEAVGAKKEPAAETKDKARSKTWTVVDLLQVYKAVLDAPANGPVDTPKPRDGSASGGADKQTDIVKALAGLGVTRFATLNYDVNLERQIHALGRRADSATASDFKRLLAPPDGTTGQAVPDDVTSGGEGDNTVRSTVLNTATAGELVNFALREGRSGSHVFHLHGRCDDPDGMLLTEEDYRRQYVAGDMSGGVLNEAMRAMFSGNDVLFVGAGLKEDDVLGPLRGVLTRDRTPDADARQTIALMPATAPKFVSTGSEKAREDALREDALFAVHQKLKYGISVLRYGRDDQAYHRLTSVMGDLQKIFESKESKLDVDPHQNELKDIKKSIPEDERIGRLAAREAEVLEDVCNKAKELHGDDVKRLATVEILKLLRGRVQARALVAELGRISRDKAIWWDDWRRLPRERRPKFHVFEPGGPYPIWVRHCPTDVTPLTALRDRPDFATAVKLGQTEASRFPMGGRPRTRILRLAVPRGGGKGALLRTLLAPDAHKQIFGRTEDYDGAFFAHMSFSMEFSSVIGALSRFVAARIGFHTMPDIPNPDGATYSEMRTQLAEHFAKWPTKALATPAPDDLLKWTTEPRNHPPMRPTLEKARLEVLRALLERYSDITESGGWTPPTARSADGQPWSGARLFICLGGLDRLCDARGDAHNPLHRAFFRLLTGSGDTVVGGGPKDPPLDILLVASRRDAPIAYLSEEIKLADLPVRHRHDYAKASATGRLLRKWHETPRLDLSSRTKLTPYWSETSRESPAQLQLMKFIADVPLNVVDRYACLRRELYESVALSNWCLSNFEAFAADGPPPHNPPDEKRIVEWLTRMNRAAEKGRFAGVLTECLEIYDEIDRADADALALRNSVLEHLALFVAPVEILVLYGCAEIRSLLSDATRADRFKTLQAALKTFIDRGLVMEIRPGGKAGRLKPADDEFEIHRRYVIHDQLRELIANRMKLFVPDGGERNHFQVSLYSEQPRDTPTPSMAQFQKVGGIVRHQIVRSRDVLGAFYVLKQFAAGDKSIEPRHIERLKNASKVIEELCLKGDDLGLLGHHGRLHAVPQRLRACYVLLRGAFSIGALSRLSEDDVAPTDMRPFDDYRDWLRGLINAAVGLHEIEPLTRAMVEGGLTADPSSEPASLAAKDGWGAYRKLLQNLESNRQTQPVGSSVQRGLSDLVRKARQNLLYKKRQTSNVGSLKHPFYVDEIAWLLNERGLASYVQGRIYDALAHFNRALDWVARDRTGADEPSYRAMERRIRLNWSIAMIDRGHIAKARAALTDTVNSIVTFEGGSPSATHLHARGYLALCDHLTGNLERAFSEYSAVVEKCIEMGNLRAVAIYDAHLSDLMSRLGDADGARRRINLARAAAAQAEQRDVLHLVILRHAQQLLSEGNVKGAIERITQAEVYGEALGLHRIRAEAMLVRAEALMQQGDARGAGAVAADGMAICNRHGLRLRRIATSILYGETLFARGEKRLARSIILEAKREADRLSYHQKAARAQRILSSFEFATPNSPPADYISARVGATW